MAGGFHVARWLHRSRFRILMYHRFPSRRALERQCAHIRRHYSPVALSEIARCLRENAPLPPLALAVTVDDGYRDFYDVAFPVFREYAIPAAVFVVTRFLDGNYWLWADRVAYSFRHTPLTRARIELPSVPLDFILDGPESRSAATNRLKQDLKLLPHAEFTSVLDSLPTALRVEIPAWPQDGFQAMNWDEARRVSANGMEIGAHTVTHPILSALETPDQLAAEVAGSRRRIEEELNRPVAHFCYPNGRIRDIGSALDAVREAGFATAVTTESGTNALNADPLLLRRIGVETSYSEAYFEQCAAAVRV